MIPTVQDSTTGIRPVVTGRSWLPLLVTACGLFVSPLAQAQGLRLRPVAEHSRLARPVPDAAPVARPVVVPTLPTVRRGIQSAISSTAAGGNWNDPATWVGGAVPTAADDVTIASGATVTLDVAGSCASLTVATGGSLLNSTTTSYRLSVAGSVTNNGTLDLSASSTIGSDLRFTGAGNASFTGTGTTDLQSISLAKSVRADVVDLNLPTISVKGNATATEGFLLTRAGSPVADDMTGTLKLSGTATITNNVVGAAAYIIPATGGIWLSNPNFTVTGQAGSPTVNGLLRISSGTYNVGSGSGNSLGFGTGAAYTQEGGTVNVAGRFNTSNAITFTLSGGALNVVTIGNASSSFSFSLSNSTAANVQNISGGTITLVQRNTAATPPAADYYVLGATNYTGGTVQFGNAATTAPTTGVATFRVAGNLIGAVVDNTTTPKAVVVATSMLALGPLQINSGSSFNLNGYVLYVDGPSITNNGTFTANTPASGTTVPGSRLYMEGIVPQTIGGSGTFSTIRQLSIQNSGGGVTIAAPIAATSVAMFQGNVNGSNNLTIGDGTAVIDNIQYGATGLTNAAGSFDRALNFNIGSGALQLIYATETSGRVTGFEVPSTRAIDYLSMSNPNGITLAGGNLTVRGDATQSVFLTNGVISTSPANTLILAETVGAPPAGSATSYVRGPLAITVNSATAVNRTFAIGDGPGWRPVVLGGITTSGPQTFTATIVSGATGGTVSGAVSSLNPTRYVRLQNTAALPASATVQLSYGADDVVGGPTTSVVAQAATANGTYASIGGAAASAPTTGLVSTLPITPGNDFFVLANTEGGALTSSVASVCGGTNSGTLTLAGYAGTITGYEANTGSGFVAVPGTNTGATLAFTNLTQTTTFRAVIQTSDNRVVYSSSVTVTVTAGPTATLAAATPTTFCGSGTLTLNATPVTGATYQFLLNGQPISGATSETYTTTVSASGSYSVVVTTGSCSATSSAVQVTVNPATSATFSYANTTFCQSGSNPTPTITGTAGGTFSSTTGLSLDAATGAINLATSTAGTYTVTYSVSGTCPSSATATVTISNAVTAGFSYAAATYCTSATGTVTPTLAAGAASGTFSSTSGLTINASTGAITPATSTPGTYTVTNTVAASGGCAAATATTTVTITAPATAGFSYATASYCTSATGTVAATLATGATAGTFSSTSGLTLNATTGAITPSTSTPGTYTVTNTVAASGACSAVTATTTVTITAPATAGFSYANASYCTSATGSATPTLSSGATAGTFSSTTGLVINASTGAINLATSTPGTYTVTNTVAASGGCAAVSATFSVTINATPAQPTITIRYNGPVTTLTSSATTGNQWYLNNILIPGATGQSYVVNSAAQYGNYTVVVTSAAGCASLPSTVQVVTSASKPLAGSSLTLYPNPTTDGLLTVKLAGYNKAVELTVYNAIGQQVRTVTVPAGRLEQPLDLTQLPSGVYMLRARTEGGTDVRRIVKE